MDCVSFIWENSYGPPIEHRQPVDICAIRSNRLPPGATSHFIGAIHFVVHSGSGWISGLGEYRGSARPLPSKRLIARTVISCVARIWQERRTPLNSRWRIFLFRPQSSSPAHPPQIRHDKLCSGNCRHRHAIGRHRPHLPRPIPGVCLGEPQMRQSLLLSTWASSILSVAGGNSSLLSSLIMLEACQGSCRIPCNWIQNIWIHHDRGLVQGDASWWAFFQGNHTSCGYDEM